MMRDNSKKKLTLLLLMGIIFIACFDTWVGASTSKAPVSRTLTTHSSSFLDATTCLGSTAPTRQSLLIVLLDRSGSLIEGSTRTDLKAIAVPGQGVYTSDAVHLECYERGGTVPPYYNNPLWYGARVITGQDQGEAWVNDHFLATGSDRPDIPVGGVPTCTTQLTGGNSDGYVAASKQFTDAKATWTNLDASRTDSQCPIGHGLTNIQLSFPCWYLWDNGEPHICDNTRATTIDDIAVSALVDNFGNKVLLSSSHMKQINDVAWSPNGKYVAWASANGTVQIWDTFDGSHLLASLHHFWIVNSIAWSYDTNTRVSLDDKNGGIRNAFKRSTTYTYPIRGDTLLEPATQRAFGILHQKNTSFDFRANVITDGNPAGRELYQLRDASFIDHLVNIATTYVPIEKALHIRQVGAFVEPIDQYNESLANEFSQRFLANAYRGRAYAHKELNDEQPKQLSELSDGTQEGFK